MKTLLVFALLATALNAQQSFKSLTILAGGTLTVNGSLAGTHVQNVGSGDTPSFTGLASTGAVSVNMVGPAQLTINGIGAGNTSPGILHLASNASAGIWEVQSDILDDFLITDTKHGVDYLTINHNTGSFSGPHIQNIGSGDSPTFDGLTINNTSSPTITMNNGSGTSGSVDSGNLVAWDFRSSSGTRRMLIFQTGDIQVGSSTTDAGYNFQVSGTANITGALNVGGGCTGCGGVTAMSAGAGISVSASVGAVTVTNSSLGAVYQGGNFGTTGAPTFSASTGSTIVQGTGQLTANTQTVTLPISFSSQTSFQCTANSRANSNALFVAHSAVNQATFTGDGIHTGDHYDFICIGN